MIKKHHGHRSRGAFSPVILFHIAHVKQLVGFFFAHFLQDLSHHRIPLRPLHQGNIIDPVQAFTPADLYRIQAVRLAGAAYAAPVAGHDFHQVVESLALVHLL